MSKGQAPKPRPVTLPINTVLRDLRKSRGLTQHRLAKLTHIHPRTIAAMETGLIKNPSFQNLITLSKFFGLSLKEFIGKAEYRLPDAVVLGSEKGEFTVSYSPGGSQLISYTPLNLDMFCGKLVIDGKKKIDGKKLGRSHKIFLQVMIGKICLVIEEKNYFLKEGQSILFNGGLAYSLANMILRKTSILFVSTPSVLRPFQRKH